MKIWWILEDGDLIKDGDQIWNYIMMQWEDISEWAGKVCDTTTVKENQPIRRSL